MSDWFIVSQMVNGAVISVEETMDLDTFLSATRSPVYAPVTQSGNLIAVSSDDANQEMGRTGPFNEMCTLCLKRPKNAQIVLGETSHVSCCLPCAREYCARQAGCPVCGVQTEYVIQQYIV